MGEASGGKSLKRVKKESTMGSCFWFYFKKLFTSWVFKKCEMNCNILKIIVVQGFCPLKLKLLDFLSDVVLMSTACVKTPYISLG